jgi:hypothetical protein
LEKLLISSLDGSRNLRKASQAIEEFGKVLNLISRVDFWAGISEVSFSRSNGVSFFALMVWTRDVTSSKEARGAWFISSCFKSLIFLSKVAKAFSFSSISVFSDLIRLLSSWICICVFWSMNKSRDSSKPVLVK